MEPDATIVNSTGSTSGEGQLIEEEGKECGKVAFGVYWDYVRHIGVWSMTAAFAALIINHAFYSLT